MCIGPPDGKPQLDSNINKLVNEQKKTETADTSRSTFSKKRDDFTGAPRSSRRPNQPGKIPTSVQKLNAKSFLAATHTDGGLTAKTSLNGSVQSKSGMLKGLLTDVKRQQRLIEQHGRTKDSERKGELAKAILKQDDEISRGFAGFKKSFHQDSFSRKGAAMQYFKLLAKLSKADEFDKNQLRTDLSSGGNLDQYTQYLEKIVALKKDSSRIIPDSLKDAAPAPQRPFTGTESGLYDRDVDGEKDLEFLNANRNKLIKGRIRDAEKSKEAFVNSLKKDSGLSLKEDVYKEESVNRAVKVSPGNAEVIRDLRRQLTVVKNEIKAARILQNETDDIKSNGMSLDYCDRVASLIETVASLKKSLEALRALCDNNRELSDELGSDMDELDFHEKLEENLKNPIISIAGSITINDMTTTRFGNSPNSDSLPEIVDTLGNALYEAEDFLNRTLTILTKFIDDSKEKKEEPSTEKSGGKNTNRLADFLKNQ